MSIVRGEPRPVDVPLVAASRDASYYSRPGRAEVRHIVADNWAACGRGPLVEEDAVPVAEVPRGGRCQRPGCRQHWPE